MEGEQDTTAGTAVKGGGTAAGENRSGRGRQSSPRPHAELLWASYAAIRMTVMRTILTACLGLLAMPMSTCDLAAQANVAVLPAAADTTLYEDAAGAIANGAGEGFFVGLIAGGLKRRALVRFDLAAIPAGARIVSVELVLQVSRGFAQNLVPVALHRVTSSWAEGPSDATLFREGQGILAVAGDNTWLHRSFATSFWNAPGGDYDPVASGVGFTPPLGRVTFASTNAMTTDVQQWLDAPATNFGWLLRTDELVPQEARRFESRTTSVVGTSPALIVRWLAAGTATSFGVGCGAPVPSLAVAGSFQVGGTFTCVVQGNPFAVSILLYELSLQQPAPEVFPGCAFYLPVSAVSPGLQFLDGAGQANTSFAVPSSPVFAGLPLAFQAVVFDASQPFGVGFTNALLLVLL